MDDPWADSMEPPQGRGTARHVPPAVPPMFQGRAPSSAPPAAPRFQHRPATPPPTPTPQFYRKLQAAYVPPRRPWIAEHKALTAAVSVGALALIVGGVLLAMPNASPAARGQSQAEAAAAAATGSPAGATTGPVSPVPGSSGNEYVTGPFTVTLVGIEPLPAKYDTVNAQGQTVPENCAEVDVKDTSAGYTGWVAPRIEFVKGHSLTGQVLETDAADPTGGDSGGSSDPLAPGQSETLYACPQDIPTGTYVEAQLTSVVYGTPTQGTARGTVVLLKY